MKVYETPEDEPVPPECRATVERIQSALDGAGAEALDADTHPTACAACRERVRAARVLLSVLAMPAEPVAVPAGLADRVVKAVGEDRNVQTRRRVYKATAWLALAAAILIGVFYFAFTPQPAGNQTLPTPPREMARPVEPAPAPREKTPTPEPAPEPRPIRFGEAVANTGQAVLDAPKPITESVAVAPKVIGVLADSFKLPAPPADPMGPALEPARRSLAELPVAARTGLEPVTGTAEKAFARFLRDVGSVKPNS